MNTIDLPYIVPSTKSKMSSNACPDCGDTGPAFLGMDYCLPCWEKRKRCDHVCRSCNIPIDPEEDICNGCAEQYLGEHFCNGCETMYKLEGEEDTGLCPTCTDPDPSRFDRHCDTCNLTYRLEKDLGTCPKCNNFGHKLICKMCKFNHLLMKERESGICKKCQ